MYTFVHTCRNRCVNSHVIVMVPFVSISGPVCIWVSWVLLVSVFTNDPTRLGICSGTGAHSTKTDGKPIVRRENARCSFPVQWQPAWMQLRATLSPRRARKGYLASKAFTNLAVPSAPGCPNFEWPSADLAVRYYSLGLGSCSESLQRRQLMRLRKSCWGAMSQRFPAARLAPAAGQCKEA